LHKTLSSKRFEKVNDMIANSFSGLPGLTFHEDFANPVLLYGDKEPPGAANKGGRGKIETGYFEALFCVRMAYK
jgi:hypothetical protein